MKLVETTNPRAHARSTTIWNEGTHQHELELARHLQFHLIGMYHAEVGPEWSSDGKLESDYLHHIDIPLSGHRQIVHNGRVVDLLPGRAYYLPGNTPVERRCSTTSQLLYLKIRCEWLRGIDPLMDRPERTPTPLGETNPEDWLHWHHNNPSINANHLLSLHAQVEIWMAAILPDLDSLVSQHVKNHSTFKKVFAMVEDQLGANLKVSMLAKAYGTGLRAFSKAFTTDVGVSPKEFINRRLNQEAITLLLNDNLKIKEVADQLEFANEFYFSRFFKKLNGVSPAQYRQRFRKGR
ncbi:MAG: AraC family transcriptional regulator [Verrucomicrobia bacterium]|nr:MAG: AraC family transcriptional regulator [Verrucomicrobiota bacterium]